MECEGDFSFHNRGDKIGESFAYGLSFASSTKIKRVIIYGSIRTTTRTNFWVRVRVPYRTCTYCTGRKFTLVKNKRTNLRLADNLKALTKIQQCAPPHGTRTRTYEFTYS